MSQSRLCIALDRALVSEFQGAEFVAHSSSSRYSPKQYRGSIEEGIFSKKYFFEIL